MTTRIEQRIERIADALSNFVGGSFHFVPRGGQLAPALAAATAPLTGASPLLNRPVALPITALAQVAEPPPYRMSRTIQTIPELWREWTVGLAGQPLIEQLDALYGASWRIRSAASRNASHVTMEDPCKRGTPKPLVLVYM